MASVNVEMIRVDEIKIEDGFNARSDMGRIEDLTLSIEARGVEVPVCVKKNKTGYFLVYGFRRFYAAKSLELPEIPAKVLPTRTPKKELFLLNMQENTARQDLNPMDEAKGAKRLLDTGYTDEEVTVALGWQKTLFTQRIQLLDYSDDLQKALCTDLITVRQARAINNLPEEKHKKFVDTASSLPVSKLRELVDKELDKLSALDNPQLADEEVEELDDDSEIVDLDDDELDAGKLSDTVIALMSDLSTHTIGEEDEQKRAQAVYVVHSIDWTSLAVADLEAFAELLTRLSEIEDFEGDADMELTALQEGNVVNLFDGDDEEEEDEEVVELDEE
jgi:ParB/RepB/Spo0J family partition protein